MDGINRRTRIKICGITDKHDLAYASELGVDAVGLVFHPQSPRHVDCPQAAGITMVRPPFISTVALFMNPEREDVEHVVSQLDIDCLQFHGDEAPEFCVSFGKPYIKALPMGGGRVDRGTIREFRNSASALLLDAHHPGKSGGGGVTFDWRQIPEEMKDDDAAPLILAGGLTPDNVGDAISKVRPFAVDVSSGVESKPGVKDPARMRRFVEAVNNFDKSYN